MEKKIQISQCNVEYTFVSNEILLPLVYLNFNVESNIRCTNCFNQSQFVEIHEK